MFDSDKETGDACSSVIRRADANRRSVGCRCRFRAVILNRVGLGPELGGRRGELASAISSRIDQLLGLLSGLTDEVLATRCEAEGWSIAFVGCHISFGLRRQANWVRRALVGSGPTYFDWERTHRLNALLARAVSPLDKTDVVRALTNAAELWKDLLGRVTDEDLDRLAFRQGEHVKSIGWVAGVVVPRHIDEHTRSIRAALGSP